MTRGYLIDTCVISEPTRAHASEKVLVWLNAVAPESVFLSVATLAALEQGIAALGAGAKARRRSSWLHDDVLPQFESRMLDVDRRVAARCGRMLGAARRAGRPPSSTHCSRRPHSNTTSFSSLATSTTSSASTSQSSIHGNNFSPHSPRRRRPA
ncbi:MAG TPA: hypothetical protein VGC30_14555 [Dokdonella sp.]